MIAALVEVGSKPDAAVIAANAVATCHMPLKATRKKKAKENRKQTCCIMKYTLTRGISNRLCSRKLNMHLKILHAMQ